MGIEDIDAKFHLEKSSFKDGVASVDLTPLLATANLETFLKTKVVFPLAGDPPITNWESFWAQWQGAGGTLGAYAGTDAFDSAVIAALLRPHFQTLGLDYSAANVADILGGAGATVDGQILALADSVDAADITALRTTLRGLFNAGFGKFLDFFRAKVVKTDPLAAQFTTMWALYSRTRTTFLDDANVGATNFQSYETMFNGFTTGITPAPTFNLILAGFIDHTISTQGYFDPSVHLEDWVDYLKTYVMSDSLPTILTKESVRDKEFRENALLLIQVFSILTEMIGVIQRLAIVQANRLEFLAKWQKVYSDLMLDMPTFTVGDGSVIGGGQSLSGPPTLDLLAEETAESDKGKEVRQDLNSNVQAMLEKLRTERQIITDEAKQFQTNVNQTSDAASSQANIATAVLQQLSGILSVIFR